MSNSYNYFEVPITFGYNFGIKKFDVFVKTGLITGFFMNAKANQIFYDESGVVNSMGKNQDEFNKISYSVSLSACINYSLTNKIGVFGEPFFRTSINSLLANNAYYKRKYTLSGLKFGLRYQF